MGDSFVYNIAFVVFVNIAVVLYKHLGRYLYRRKLRIMA